MFLVRRADGTTVIPLRMKQTERTYSTAVNSSVLKNAANHGAALEVALVKDAGATGCVYIDDGTYWVETGCWGTPDYTFDQLEVRVRSFAAGEAFLEVYDVAYQ